MHAAGESDADRDDIGELGAETCRDVGDLGDDVLGFCGTQRPFRGRDGGGGEVRDNREEAVAGELDAEHVSRLGA